MSQSFFRSRKDSLLAAGSANFSTKISATPTAYGLVAAQATAYAALDTAFQSAYLAATTPDTRTKSTVAAKNSARIPLRQMASDLAKIIGGTPTVTDAQKVDLGISVRATPTPRPAPGTPNRFNVALASDGSLALTWKCDNPKGSTGTMYQVWRRVGAAGQFEYLGGSGKKDFVDATIPAAASQITYQIQAVRSTAIGAWAQYNVNFGSSGSGPVVAEVTEETAAAPLRRAA